MTEYSILNVPEYACFENARVLIYLIILGIWKGFEYASDIKRARVLNTSRYSYNSIIATNLIILEFFCSICTSRRSTTNHFIFFFFFNKS